MKTQFSRRKFLTGASAAAVVSILPFSACTSSDTQKVNNALVTPDGKPNSKFNGVQIGAITYSFRSMANTSDEVIAACIGAGLSSIELMGHSFETEIGAPTNPVVRGRGDNTPLTTEETAAREKYVADLETFRKDPATMDKWAALGKKFKDAGIDIHIFKWTAGNTDDLLDYSFAVAKAIGAQAICTEISEDACKTLGTAAARNGMLATFHQHAQYSTMTTDEIDRLLALSPANRLNFDCGHYFGAGWENSTKLTPIQFIDKYADKIFSIHLKDKTSYLNTDAPNQNQVWGQGQTPLRDILQHVRDNYPHLYLDIELEYAIAPWSDAVKETAKCVRHAREILI